MRRVKKVLLGIVAGLVLLILGGLGYAYFAWGKKPLPQVDGDLAVAGLDGQVTIRRDGFGIPHIYAGSDHDLFFAQGFVHAQDRLWAMESSRRAAHGTLAEVIGDKGLGNDRMMRVLGMTEAAEADWDTLDPDTQAALQAYADGVNAYLALGKLPIELRILGVAPQPWTPVDTLVVGKLVSWGLSNNMQDELIITQLADAADWETVLSLLPDYPGPDVIPDANLSASAGVAGRLLDVWASADPKARPDQGSNAWVVGGTRTASGMPMLANDPHQTLLMPSLWYEVGLHTSDGRYEVAGASIPGIPGVEIGHNDRIAWGVTNARPDVQDLFVETIDGDRYLFEGEWRDLTVREERIEVKGSEPVVLQVRATHHGPIVSDVIDDADQDLALRWTGFDQGRPLAAAILTINRAHNWNEFREGLRLWQLPGMNFVYGDVDGHIGYQMSGAVPIRKTNDVFGLVPADGADGRHEWTGFIPFDELPSDTDPAGDFYASANNRPVGADYPYFLSHYFQPPYRVQLIGDTLRSASGATPQDFADLQANRYSDLNRQVAEALAGAADPETDVEQQVVELLEGWDGTMAPDSVAATVSEVAMWQLIRTTVEPVVGAAAADAYTRLAGYPYMYLQTILDDPGSPRWGGDHTGVLRRALRAAIDDLTATAGDDLTGWAWGAVHTMTFSHPLGSIGPLAPIFNRGPYEAGGNWNTVNSGAYLPEEAYRMSLGPAYRIIVDVGAWEATRSIIPTGQSGQPFSPHYDDQIEPWLAVEYHSLPFSPIPVREAARHTLTLTPAG